MTDIVYGIRITGEASGAKKAFDETRQAQDKLTGAERDNSRAAAEIERSNERKTAALNRLRLSALAAGAAMLAALRSMSNAAIEAERSMARLNAMWAATGGTSGLSRAQQEGLVQRMAGATRFDDEAIRDAMGVLSTFQQVSGQAFEETIKMAAGMAEVFRTDLQSAVMMLGKALEDPVNGLDALRRGGIVFSDGQKEVIKNLVDTGRAADAQQIILRELKTKGFDVVAEAMNQGMGRAANDMAKQWNELLETLGQTQAVHVPVTGFFTTVANTLAAIKRTIESGDWLDKLSLIDPTGATMAARSMRGMLRGPESAAAPGARDDSSPEAAGARLAAQQARWQAAYDVQQSQLKEFLKKRAEEEKKADEERVQSQASTASAYARLLGSQQQVMDDVVAQSPEFIRAQFDRTTALEKEAEAVRDTLNPWNAYAREVERLRALLDKGAISQREFGDAVAAEAGKVGGALDDMADKGVQSFDELKDAIEGWGRDLSRELARGEVSLRSFGRLFEELLAMQTQRRLMQPILASGTKFLDGLFNTGGELGGGLDAGYTGYTGHTGGIVGAQGIGTNPSRYVHPSYFERAPRLHSGGLAGDEVPAILRRGEGVFTPEQMRAMGGAGNVTVKVINQTGMPEMDAKVSNVQIDAGGMAFDLLLRRLSKDASAREQLGGLLKGPANY